jgi:hypothetical protein
MIPTAVSTPDALAAYQAKVAEARAKYREACKLLADLPSAQRAAQQNSAFADLKDIQQNAMRILVASEFAEVMKLRPATIDSGDSN